MLWNYIDAERATDGISTYPWTATGISIDSRTLKAGDLFIALTHNRDGHEFVDNAFSAGAAAALVSCVPNNVSSDCPLILVSDVQKAFEDLARYQRKRFSGKVIAITGSVGKTSCKEMLKTALEHQGRTQASEKSHNNQWGVPLTICRASLNTDYLIVEVGMNSPGEIAPLSKLIKPDVGIITNIAPAHLAAFDSIEAIASEKATLFSGLNSPSIAILNSGSPCYEILLNSAQESGADIVTCGNRQNDDYFLAETNIHAIGTTLRYKGSGIEQLVKLSAIGVHFASNALIVLAAVRAVGCDIVTAALDLRKWQPPPGRGNHHEIVLDRYNYNSSFILIDDAFNSNPVSLSAGLDALCTMHTRKQRIAILGDMLELGVDEVNLHSDVARLPAINKIAKIHCTGTLMHHLYSELPAEKRGFWVNNPEELSAIAHKIINAGDIVLVKGSKGSRASIIATALRQLDQSTS